MSGKVLRFYSEFGDGEGRTYRVEIWGPDEGAAAERVYLTWDEPAVIEWGEVTKTDSVQGSGLTLRLVSPDDRHFTCLYSTDACEWRVDVWREGALYWSGTVDPELYDEPYHTREGYEVAVTASDFGVMERVEYSGRGVRSVGALLEECVGACGLHGDVWRGRVLGISTGVTADGGGLDLWGVYVDSGNWYDEDGKGMTLREVAESVLAPLGLRMVQRMGAVHVVDLNWLAGEDAAGCVERIVWMDSDQRLGVDRTYSRVRVRLSAYEDTTGLDGRVDHDAVAVDETGGALVRQDMGRDAPDGFWVYAGGAGDATVGRLSVMNGARLLRIDAEYSGSDCGGVVYNYKSGRAGADVAADRIEGNGWPVHYGTYAGEPLVPLMALGGMRVAGSEGRDAGSGRYMLKVSLDLLLDVRYNPFEEASADNDGDSFALMERYCDIMYVPVAIVLRGADGGVRAWYDNSGVVMSEGYSVQGRWRTDGLLNAYVLPTCSWLSFYDWDDRKGMCGIGGWSTNRQTIGEYVEGDLPRRWKARGDGLYIPLPPVAGWLSLEVGTGVYRRPRFVSATEAEARSMDPQCGCHGRCRWLAYKDARVELVSGNGRATEGRDIEDSAWITRGASDELSLETKVGTPGDRTLPTARGLLLDGDGMPLRRLWRGGVEDRLERLLIGTVYSQYASERSTLSGTCGLIGGVGPLLEDSAEVATYVMVADTQDLARGVSVIKAAEFGRDDYEGVEISTGDAED